MPPKRTVNSCNEIAKFKFSDLPIKDRSKTPLIAGTYSE